MNNGSIMVPVEFYEKLVRADERLRILDEITREEKCISINACRIIIGVKPLPDSKEELAFDKMFEDVPGIEEMTCT